MDTLPPGPMLIVLLVLLLINAVITYVETATVAINDAKLKALAESGDKRAKRLFRLLDERPSQFMDAMEFSINFLGFLISGCVAVGLSRHLAAASFAQALPFPAPVVYIVSVLLVTLALTYVYLVLGVFIPKRIAGRTAERAALWLVSITLFVTRLLRPFVWLSSATANGILRLFGIKAEQDDSDVTEEEIRMMVDIGSETGAIDDDEKKMIHNIFELDDKPVEDIMTHRTDVDILWINDGAEKWLSFINETNHTRYPVCGETIDDVIGTLNSRDFYRFLLSDRNGDLRRILRQPYFVPESIKANELFRKMQEQNTHFTIVLDEYGGFRGIVTQEDLLEEIVGELYSEYDQPEEIEDVVQLDESTWRIQGSAELEDVSEALGIELESDEYNTFAGMILDALGTVPDDGTTPELSAHNLQIKVTKIDEHRIEEAVVCLLKDVETAVEEAEAK